MEKADWTPWILLFFVLWHFDSKLDDMTKLLKEIDTGNTMISAQIDGLARRVSP